MHSLTIQLRKKRLLGRACWLWPLQMYVNFFHSQSPSDLSDLLPRFLSMFSTTELPVVTPLDPLIGRLSCYSIVATLIGLPSEIRSDFSSWNSMTHGNITFVVILCSVRYVFRLLWIWELDIFGWCNWSTRIAWFLGIGRKTYYYGQPAQNIKKED